MALSIYDVLYHAQNDKYPQIIKGPGLIQGITPVVDQEGTEAFGFYRPSISGAIDPSGIPEGEVAYVSKADLENYSQRVFGQELPQIIDSHRVSTQYGESQIQSPSATKGADPRYSRVKAGGINENHGWKIHADLVQDQDYDQAMASIGRSSDHSIADKSVAEAFDKRLRNLGMETDDFLQHFKRLGTDPRDGNVKFINPQDLATSMEVFERNSVTYKMTALTYGEGRHITAYPQSIVNRDKLITDMENSLGQRLVDQNDPAYRARLGPEVGVKNHPLSRGVSGRFTTDYLDVDPNTGKVDFSLSGTGNPAPEEYKISGKISSEEIETINRVNAEMPEMAELLHGPNGYVSPYRTIEQIAQDRASGAINVSHTINSSIVDANSPHGLAFAPVGGVVHNPQRNPLPPINGRGQVSAPGTPPPTSGPSVSTANATKVTPLVDEYDTGAKSAELADGGKPVLGTREAKRDVVVDSLLRDENHPDPAKAEFNRRWNEQVRKNSSAPTNKADPFGGMSERAIEDDIYNEVKAVAPDAPTPPSPVDSKGAAKVTSSSARKGPGDLGKPAPEIKTKPGPHGAKAKPSGPTIDTLSSLSAEEKLAMSGLDEGSETTTKMGARIVTETADNDIKAMQALREIGGKMNTFREGGGKVLSRDAGKALSEAVTQGIKGSKNLRLAALGTAVGLGAYGVSRFQHRRTNSDLQS